MTPLFNAILENIEGPEVSDELKSQFLITSLDYDSYVGQIAVGRLNNGTLSMNKSYSLCKEEGTFSNQKFSTLYTFQGLKKVQVEEVSAGDIIIPQWKKTSNLTSTATVYMEACVNITLTKV